MIKDVVYEMASVAGLDDAFAEDFYNRIKADDAVLDEFITYLRTGQFKGEDKVRGYSIVDILVWQMDHFKAFLDRESLAKNNNECETILTAFDVFMKLKADPEKYIGIMSAESGSDYDGKF